MSNQCMLSIYINIIPKRWRITNSYRALCALERLSKFRKLGYVPDGIHDGIGTRTNFVLHVIFASLEDKQAYEQDRMYEYSTHKLKRYSKKGGLKLTTQS